MLYRHKKNDPLLNGVIRVFHRGGLFNGFLILQSQVKDTLSLVDDLDD